jgi:guanylate kinase
VILKIEVEGGQIVKKHYPDAVLIFTFPPSAEVREIRLRSRGTEDEQTVRKRLTVAQKEIEIAQKVYDYLIINDDADDAARKFADIISAGHAAMSQNTDFMNEVRDHVKNHLI